MTKTQALQRLYKALTGNEGRNTGSKVIEDLAVAAENGEIGGGGKLATVSFTMTTGAMSAINTVSVDTCTVLGGICATTGNRTLVELGTKIGVPIIGEGTIIALNGITDYVVTISGSIDEMGEGSYIVYGDCEIHFDSKK